MENTKNDLPNGFLLDITTIPGSALTVCEKAIHHYSKYINDLDPTVSQIAKAMVGNLTQYYNIANPQSPQFQLALPHLSEMARFMDDKSENSTMMDIQSTARIKSFYSTYEKLLSDCAKYLEKNIPIPTSDFAKDLIATRDIFSPRYQLKNNPEEFYKYVYSSILDFMEYIDGLKEQDPNYGFVPIDEEKSKEILAPKKYKFPENANIHIPEKEFLDYALDIKGISPIYKRLVAISPKFDFLFLRDQIKQFQLKSDAETPCNNELVQAIKNNIDIEFLTKFRNELEQEFLDNALCTPSMINNYNTNTKEEFLYLYKLEIKPLYKDYLNLIADIDTALAEGRTPQLFSDRLSGGMNSLKILTEKFSKISAEKDAVTKQALSDLYDIDLSTFQQDFKEAKKLKYYASCTKDYMRNPKASGYQSFHISIKTPFGYYEKQIRTQEQHNFAEYGHASHSNSYKPYEKESFHRLKICTPLMPKRDATGEIIFPINLTPIPFEDAVREYYHKGFEFFANGMSMQEFVAAHPNDFDEAMLKLSQPNEKLIERVNKSFNFLNVLKRIPKIFTGNDDSHSSR